MTDFVGPDSVTTSVLAKQDDDRSEWYEIVSRRVSDRLSRLKGKGGVLEGMAIDKIWEDFQLFMARLPTEVAHELARRYADDPEKLRNFKHNREAAPKLANQIQIVLNDLANRKDE